MSRDTEDSSAKVAPTPLLKAMCTSAVAAYLISSVDNGDAEGILDLDKHVVEIVTRNVASGRAGRVIRAQTDAPGAALDSPALDTTLLAAYIERVIKFYLQEHRRVDQLAARDAGAWYALYDQLERRAYALVRNLDASSAPSRAESADFAQQACETIFTHVFPFDVSFDPWAALILRNVILQHYRRSSDATDHFLFELDPDRPIRAESDMEDFKRLENQEQLLQAIAQLTSKAQQQVILDVHLRGLSEAEVATKLGKTENAVRILQHRALRGLKKILAK